MLPALRQLKRSGNPATTFEAWTVLAAEAFRQAEVDLAVVEVGMGGRLDATSAWDRKVLCLLTQVSLEHTRELGPDRTAICQEKVAIARPGVPFLSAEADPALRALIRKHGRTTGCPVEFIGTEVHDAGRLLDWQRTEYGVRVSMNLRGQALTLGVGLRGEHQAYNAVLAALAVQTLSRCGYPVSLRAWQRSFRRVAWPGRLERIQRNPDVFLDGAHNPDAARVVAQEMQIMHRPVFLVTGIMADKDVAGVIRALAPAVRQVWTVTPPDSRGLPAPKLAAGFRAANVPAQACRSLGQAVHAALAAANRHGVVLVTGSLYILESARRALIRAGKTHLTSTRR
jgi:dihydrofolate synthase/folylpolyglutamate synthase